MRAVPSARTRLSPRISKKSAAVRAAIETAGDLSGASAENSRSLGNGLAGILIGLGKGHSSALAVLAPRGPAGRGPMNGSLSRSPEGERLADPAAVYQRAFDEVRKWAEAVGKEDVKVYFGEALAAVPVEGGRHWKLTFYLSAEETPTVGDAVTVEFKRVPGAGPETVEPELSFHHDAAFPADQPVFRLPPFQFARLGRVKAGEALAAAQRMAPYLGSRVQVSLRLEVHGEEAEERGLWYHFFDERGNETAVSAWTSEVRELTKPEIKTTEEKKESVRLWKQLKDIDAWLGEHLPLYETAKWLALIGVGLWLLDMAVGFAEHLPMLFGS